MMKSPTYSGSPLFLGLKSWWRDECAAAGVFSTLRRLVAVIWVVLRESLPQNKKQRYGDIDYDWDYRVDTTAATVSWPTRLLGQLNSPYQPTDPAIFHEMLANLKLRFEDFTFIDIGSGKGRALLMAADYPFRRIVGIELLAELHRSAVLNVRRYHGSSQKCFLIETRCMEARKFQFPSDPMVIYLFNPLPKAALASMISKLCESLQDNPRSAYVVYHNPEYERVFDDCGIFRKIVRTEQYSIFTNVN